MAIGQRTLSGGNGKRVESNLPHVAALFLPFSFLSLPHAWLAWQAFQILCACDVLRRVMAAGTLRASPESVIALVLCPATLGQIAMAQVGWTLAWLVSMAWFARESRTRLLGVWLGLAIASKPFLLILLAWLILRGRRFDVSLCLATIAAACAGGVAVAGRQAYATWLDRTANIHYWESWPLNWSLVGAWRRVAPAAASDHPVLYAILALALVVVLWRLRTIPVADPAGWVLALSSSLLLSPLGWGYYAWILLAPTTAWLVAQPGEGPPAGRRSCSCGRRPDWFRGSRRTPSAWQASRSPRSAALPQPISPRPAGVPDPR